MNIYIYPRSLNSSPSPDHLRFCAGAQKGDYGPRVSSLFRLYDREVRRFPLTAKQITDLSELQSCSTALRTWEKICAESLAKRVFDIEGKDGRFFQRLESCYNMCGDAHDDISALIGRLQKQEGALRSEVYVCTQGGLLQPQAVLFLNESDDELHVYALVSAPWNIVPFKMPWKVRGAGTCLMKEVIRKGIQSGKKISLSAVRSSREFYQNLGFTPGVPFTLTPEAARARYPELV